jgi:arylsulfatase A-like enzyme
MLTVESTQPPNIVFIRVDDMDAASLAAVRPDTGQLVLSAVADLAASGMRCEANYVTFAVCTPSRASMFSGQYVHNHHTYGNDGILGGMDSFDHSNALPVWLRSAGYYNVFAGKYMNQAQHVQPAGWDECWFFLGAKYYDYNALVDGVEVHYGNAPTDYSTDVITARATDFILSGRSGAQPFYLNVDYCAPHSGGSIYGDYPPAPRHNGIMNGYVVQHGPAYNEADVSDKPSSIQALPLMDLATQRACDLEIEKRLRTLLAVNDGINAIIAALQAADKLGNTYVVFTSDNGWYSGEHRIPGGKMGLYEEAVRVPLVVRGPGVPQGVTSYALTANIDLASTFCEIAGATPGRVQDGRSLMPLLTGQVSTWTRTLLLENYDYAMQDTVPTLTVSGIRYSGGKYAEYLGGDLELYDLVADPFELASQHANPAKAVFMARRAADLHALQNCSGAGCDL